MMITGQQEKMAAGILVMIICACSLGTVLLDGMGKEQFSQSYVPGLSDGTLVSWSGSVSSLYVAAGGSIMLDVSGVKVFVPVSAGNLPEFREGSMIGIIGTVQHWNGDEEILVGDSDDVRLI